MKASISSLRRSPENPARHRHRFPAWLVPAVIAFGFALLFLLLFRDRILPAREVRVAMVLATSAAADGVASAAETAPATDGPMSFQASGWVEPDPLPIKATALVNGVVDEVHVLEGQEVAKGQPLATLIREDFEIALKSARQNLRMREAELATHLDAVETSRRIVVVARAGVDAAAAVVTEADDRYRRLQGLPGGSVSEGDVVASRSALQKSRAEQAASVAAVARDEAEVKQMETRTTVLQAAIDAAAIDLERAELDLSRTRIAAPADGRVLRLVAVPGQKKILNMDDPESSTVAILYDPMSLQVRVDVPLADAAGLQIGQRARIRCSLLPDTVFHGEVTRITGEADLQRNTLQAKVRIEDPSDLLRPEMLCRVEFLETTRAADTSVAGSGALVTWIPQDALAGDVAWVCNPDDRRVQARNVRPGGETRDGFIRIDEGLRPGEWVVISPEGLDDGQRVNPTLIQP